MKHIQFSDLIGMTLTNIEGIEGDDEMVFTSGEGRKFVMYHAQDCCEFVRVEDICGDVADLIGNPIVLAEESSNSDNPPPDAESFTWTFYKLATNKGSVTIRWLGESSGYYGESVEFCERQS